MSEREHHIKVLEQFLHAYQEWGEDLELEETIKYAISSLKTDLKYDLMYDGEEIYTKADIVVMLEKLKKSIEDKVYNVSAYSECLDCDVIDYEDVNEIIIEKINALKEK